MSNDDRYKRSDILAKQDHNHGHDHGHDHEDAHKDCPHAKKIEKSEEEKAKEEKLKPNQQTSYPSKPNKDQEKSLFYTM